MRAEKAASRLLLCIRSGGSEDLEPRKVYQVLPDRAATQEGYVRVIDESGEDYLYPSEYFVPVKLSAAVTRQLLSVPVGALGAEARKVRRG